MKGAMQRVSDLSDFEGDRPIRRNPSARFHYGRPYRISEFRHPTKVGEINIPDSTTKAHPILW